jgi:hypothetical protein
VAWPSTLPLLFAASLLPVLLAWIQAYVAKRERERGIKKGKNNREMSFGIIEAIGFCEQQKNITSFILKSVAAVVYLLSFVS